MKPFFRWAGGKARIADEIVKLIGPISPTARYVEPFVGGGAVFWALEREGQALLNDVSLEVVRTLKAVRDYPQNVTDVLNGYRKLQEEIGYSEAYNRMKRDVMAAGEQVFFAPAFLALNQTCFNGLWRVNQRAGEFNVPMGYRVVTRKERDERGMRKVKKKLPYDINPLDLSAYSRLLQFTRITCGSYSEIELQRGDIAYCDPPYFKQFNGYSKEPFTTKEHHEELRDWCRRGAERGARVILSGADNAGTRSIYGKPTLELNRACTIGCKDRKRVGELLYVWE